MFKELLRLIPSLFFFLVFVIAYSILFWGYLFHWFFNYHLSWGLLGIIAAASLIISIVIFGEPESSDWL